jgi:hypothetical protein
MNNDNRKHRRQLFAKIMIAIVSLIITAFYVVSALGWFMATFYMSRTGQLGNEATAFYQSLNIFDHIVRSSQVLLIVVATILLLLFRRVSLKLILSSILLSIVTTLFAVSWAISFLAGLWGIIMLAALYGYAYFLNRRGYLH